MCIILTSNTHWLHGVISYIKRSLDYIYGLVLNGLIIEDDRFCKWEKKEKTIFTLSISRSHRLMFLFSLSIYRSCLGVITIFIYRATFNGKMCSYIHRCIYSHAFELIEPKKKRETERWTTRCSYFLSVYFCKS